MESNHDYDQPPRLENEDSYEEWKKAISLWTIVTDIPKEKQAIAVALGLKGKARKAALEISMHDLNSDDGLKILLKTLDEVLAVDSMLIYKAFQAFDSLRRTPFGTLKTYVQNFYALYTRLKEVGVTFSEKLVMLKLLSGAVLKDSQVEAILRRTGKGNLESAIIDLICYVEDPPTFFNRFTTDATSTTSSKKCVFSLDIFKPLTWSTSTVSSVSVSSAQQKCRSSESGLTSSSSLITEKKTGSQDSKLHGSRFTPNLAAPKIDDGKKQTPNIPFAFGLRTSKPPEFSFAPKSNSIFGEKQAQTADSGTKAGLFAFARPQSTSDSQNTISVKTSATMISTPKFTFGDPGSSKFSFGTPQSSTTEKNEFVTRRDGILGELFKLDSDNKESVKPPKSMALPPRFRFDPSGFSFGQAKSINSEKSEFWTEQQQTSNVFATFDSNLKAQSNEILAKFGSNAEYLTKIEPPKPKFLSVGDKEADNSVESTYTSDDKEDEEVNRKGRNSDTGHEQATSSNKTSLGYSSSAFGGVAIKGTRRAPSAESGSAHERQPLGPSLTTATGNIDSSVSRQPEINYPAHIQFPDPKKDQSDHFPKWNFKFQTPEEMDRANKKLEADEKAEDDETSQHNDTGPHFEPLVNLPEVEIRTGEEEENVMFSERAKLFRWNEGQWKERGVGEMKILKHDKTGKYRLLMRRDQVLKICCNHLIGKEMDLKPMPRSDKALIWHAMDFSDEEGSQEGFAIRFKTAEMANAFKKKFLEGKEENMKLGGGTPVRPAPKQAGSSPTVLTSERSDFTPSITQTKSSVSVTALPKIKFSFPKPSAAALALAAKISGKQTQQTKTRQPKVDKNQDEVAHNESGDGPHFEPIIKLPDKVDVVTGEENEEVIFGNRGRLFTYHKETKQWKERGVGDVKILQNLTNFKVRVMMRREQVFKVCLNHFLQPELKLTFKEKNSSRTLLWSAKDFSDRFKPDGEALQLALRFEDIDTASSFKDSWEDGVQAAVSKTIIDPDPFLINSSAVRSGTATYRSDVRSLQNPKSPLEQASFSFANVGSPFVVPSNTGPVIVMGFVFGEKPEKFTFNNEKFKFDVSKLSFNV